MKKFGTPMRAGPGVASEKPGFVGAGDPSGLVRTGAGGAGVVDAGVLVESRPEVEVECLTVPVPPTAPLPVLVLEGLRRWWDGVELGVVVGVAVGVEPGVAVPAGAVGVLAGSSVGVLVGSGATVVFTGEGNGEGSAVCAGVAVAEDVGAAVAVAVCAGVEVEATVGAADAVDVAAGEESGVGDAVGSCAGASAPRHAAKMAAPARPMARMRRVKVWSKAGAPRCG